VPVIAKINVRPKAEPLAGIFEKVKLVTAAFSETANTLPKAQFKAKTPAEIAGAVCFSISPVIVGVVSAGEVAKTLAPVPVSSVIIAIRLALVGVARNVAAPVPRPLTPVDIGRPVQLVSVPLVGVPSKGVTSVGLVASALAPLPVEVVTPVPPDKTASVALKDAAEPVIDPEGTT